jgi:hypothetical protein
MTALKVRLSDFLMWQSGYTCLVFRDTLWPEFTFWDLFICLMTYQRNHAKLATARLNSEANRERLNRALQTAAVVGGATTFTESAYSTHSVGTPLPGTPALTPSAHGEVALKEARVTAFLDHIRCMRNSIYVRMDNDSDNTMMQKDEV